MRHISLKTKLIITFAFLGIVPLLLMGGLALYVINYTHQQDVTTMEGQLLNQKSAEASKFLDDTAGLFEIQVGYQSQSAISDRDQQFLLESLLQNPNIMEVSFADTSGQETQKISNVQDESLVPLFNVSRMPGFAQAKAGQIYFGPVEQTQSGPMMTIAGPVTSEGGDVVMVVMGKISLQPLVKTTALAVLGNTGYLYVVDSSKSVIASADQKYLGTSVAGVNWINDVLKGKRQTTLLDIAPGTSLTNQEVLAAGVPLPKLNWALLVEWPKDDAFSLVNEVRLQVIYLLIFSLLIISLLGWLVGRSILKPLHTLQAVATKIGEGDFEAKTNIHTGDELEEFGQILNKAAVDLKRLKELREEFVFIASHELRTPVTAIKGYLSMIMDGDAGPVSDDVKKMLNQVSTANQRLVQLVEDLLQVARSEAGRLTIDVQPIEIPPVVDSVLKELLPLAADKKIYLTYAPDEALPKAFADAARLKEVLINLVGNAIKYTIGIATSFANDRGGGQVTITHEIADGMLVTKVFDTGIGMTPEEQAKLFEKFYRIKNSDTQNIQGTGLGLFIVKQIIEKMGGKIWVTSAKGKGSTFSFSLPLAK